MKVLVVDDQTVVREGLVTILQLLPGIEVVGAAANGQQAIEQVAEQQPDVVLMDLRMPELDGVAATTVITSEHPHTKVVVLTTYADDDSILAALSAGAIGYLTKDANRDDIYRALEAAANNQVLLDPQVASAVINATQSAPVAVDARSQLLPDGLTDREGQVLALVAQGLSNLQIARRLVIGESTVKTHINRIFAKTGSRDRAQAVAYAHKHRIEPR